ncbi:uncharacterized protein LOC129598319 [Paramacrobiotus metropolitanus]|uniref:uncharacterized protein LOC129598319 n=1 Tax=Paramacrobiotus metropolitanus TaxID=2943436 RepID=UPI0024461DE5|nr:uncharacterized protein LOC129598319 [Paramacrobiotus metropolitanus]
MVGHGHGEKIEAGTTFARETLNGRGCEYNYNDEYFHDFLQFAAQCGGTVADLGCAYGASTKRLLDAGATKVIANDICKEHLDIFYDSLNEMEKKRVQCIPGDALELEKYIPAGSLAGIIAASWLNFLTPEQIKAVFGVFYNLLQPGGKLCILAASCYSDLMESQHAQDVVAKRKAAGDQWPGLWNKAELYKGPFAHHLPDFMHCLDPDVLSREATARGFKVDKAGHFDFGSVFQALKVDGREWTGIIATKPK